MTTTPDLLDLPARRRRHARLVAALTTLIGACAAAAGAVYQPIADAPPDQEGVEVSLLPCVQVSVSAALLLDRARAEDDARWPAAVTREQREARRTYAARCAVAQAQDLTEPQPESQPGEHGVPLPTAKQATLDLVGASEEIATLWRRSPADAKTRVRKLVSGGEFTADELLNEAVDSAALTALLTLHAACDASDASHAAELCLAAVPYIALAVSLASADL